MDGLSELLEGIETTAYPGWSSNVTSSTSPPLTAEMIKRVADAIASYVPKPFTVILPPPVVGNDQAARRRRRIRLASGAILELPSGSNPIVYLLTGGEQWR